jgi:hypothetical protein
MPVEHRLDFLFQSHRASKTGTGGWIDHLIKRYDSSNSDDISAGQELSKACRFIIECDILGANSQKSDSVSTNIRELKSVSIDRLLEKIMLGGLRMNDQSLCCEALSVVREEFPQPTTVKVIERFGFAQLKSK